jgi:exopolyphosphatase/guanosine-5'-triphosphate,3'-diphosphate pyrophosphatase
MDAVDHGKIAPTRPVVCACIDIGSNTARLLVAECDGGSVHPLLQERAFTRLGADEVLPPGRAEAVARAVAAHVARARSAGARALRVVATAGVRRTPDADALVALIEDAAGVAVDVIDEAEEARLAFAGATRGRAGDERVAVVDIGGGSTEVAAGFAGAPPDWWVSLPLGSAVVGGDWAFDGPPGEEDLRLARERAAAAWDAVGPPPCGRALAVGGSATSLWRLAGPSLTAEGLARALARVCAAAPAEVAKAEGLEEQRVRLLPAGIVLLDEARRRLGGILEIGGGGVREGVVLELAGHGTAPSS